MSWTCVLRNLDTSNLLYHEDLESHKVSFRVKMEMPENFSSVNYIAPLLYVLQMCPSVANVPAANVRYCCKYALLFQICQLPTIPKFFKILENILNFAEILPEMLSGCVSNVPTKFFVFLQFGVGARVYFVLF